LLPAVVTAPFQTLEAFDALLHASYSRLQAELVAMPTPELRRRFAHYLLFPRPGWDLPAVGEAQALAADDPAWLQGMLVRLVKCAHACWGVPAADGLHWGGGDHSAQVMVVLYAAPLGRRHLQAAFHGGCAPSRHGWPAYRHAANLLVSLEDPAWRHRAATLDKARAFAAGRGGAAIDRAFVALFIALLDQQSAAVNAALLEVAAGYLRSDWGRHKPQTRSAFLHTLLAEVQHRLPGVVSRATLDAMLPDDACRTLWLRLADHPPAAALQHRFGGALAFMDDLPLG
jgi:hypothetical protein